MPNVNLKLKGVNEETDDGVEERVLPELLLLLKFPAIMVLAMPNWHH